MLKRGTNPLFGRDEFKDKSSDEEDDSSNSNRFIEVDEIAQIMAQM